MGFGDKVFVAEALRSCVNCGDPATECAHQGQGLHPGVLPLDGLCGEREAAADAELAVDHNATHLSESADFER